MTILAGRSLHSVCSQVLRDRRFARIWTDAQPVAEFTQFNCIYRWNMLSNDAGHHRLRSAVASVFDRRRMQNMRERVAAHAQQLVVTLAERATHPDGADLIELVAAPLSITVISEWLGVPPTDQPLLRPWSNAIVKMYEPAVNTDQRRRAEPAASEFADYAEKLITERRRRPADDLLSDLISAADHAANGGLIHDELREG
ncbi:hypothetical protein [Actinopolyspora saharensis]|uniref:hypothetical protein n=1 Tax=Actinopolyspora saharensis TaxID=995062 RepID=UPI003F66433B